jgi:hypothetical protein
MKILQTTRDISTSSTEKASAMSWLPSPRAIQKNNHLFAIDRNVTAVITGIMHDFETGKDVYKI